MKLKWLTTGLLTLIALLAFSTVKAATIVQKDSFLVAKDQTLSGNQYVRADTVQVEGRIEGDLVVKAREISINGVVTGSVLAIASHISVHGNVMGSLRSVSRTLIVDGQVDKDVTSVSNSLKLPSQGSINGSLFYITGTSDLQGHVQEGTKDLKQHFTRPLSNYDLLFALLRSFLALSLTGVVLYIFQPYATTERLRQDLAASFLLNWALGVLTLIICPMIIIFLLLIGVGKWLAILTLGVFLVSLILAFIDTAYFLGRLVMLKEKPSPRFLVALFFLGSFITTALLAMSIFAVIPLIIWLAALGARLRFWQSNWLGTKL